MKIMGTKIFIGPWYLKKSEAAGMTHEFFK